MKRRRTRKIKGKGIQRPYVSKRNRLMLGKGKSKQKGGFFLAPFIYQNRAMTKHLKKNNMIGRGKKQKGGFFASLIDEIWN